MKNKDATIDIQVSLCKDDLNLVKCPRCIKWHGTVFNLHVPDENRKDNLSYRHILCDDCTLTLLQLGGDYLNEKFDGLNDKILENRRWQFETKPWTNREEFIKKFEVNPLGPPTF